MTETTALPAAAPTTDPHAHDTRLSLGGRIGTFLGIVIPLSGVVTAAALAWGWGFQWSDLTLLVGMYFLSALGVTVGFHRLLVHRSFETYTPIKFVLAVLGSTAVQGPVLKWCGLHRRHHQFSDVPGDVHSPHLAGDGVVGFLLGFWNAHIGWAFRKDPPNLDHYVKDLSAIPSLRVASKLFPLWAFLGVLAPTVLGGLMTGTWLGALTGFLWGGLVRIFLLHHVTWSINSACHLWGSRAYESADHSRNNVVFGILAMGEGWHNNHHAFPTSARHGLKWWQIDVSYWVIKGLALVGLAWNLKLPSQQAIMRGRRMA